MCNSNVEVEYEVFVQQNDSFEQFYFKVSHVIIFSLLKFCAIKTFFVFNKLQQFCHIFS